MMDSTLVSPNGEPLHAIGSEVHPGDRATIVNETGLPDELIEGAVRDEFVQNASLAWGRNTTFQTYHNQGSLLARSDFRVPTNVIEEIKLARDLAERDDDVGAALGWCLAAAYEGGLQHHHQDDKTVALFTAFAKDSNLEGAFQELHREWLISGQINTIHLFSRTDLDYQTFGDEQVQSENLAAPLIGVLPAENIRVLGNDMFGTGTLAYDPDSEALRKWLEEYFSEETTPARKHAMGLQDRVSANLFTGYIDINPWTMDAEEMPTYGQRLYLLNPRMVKRSTTPKGAWKYPRPRLTRNFALLEAKRLLNIMDYSLLQGGSNFIVIAKKGDKDRPAQQPEIDNLKELVKRSSKTGVIVGDHRLSFEILTPDLTSLLNPEKRRLLGKKLAMALLCTPEHGTENSGGEGMKGELEMQTRVISLDRRSVKLHVENTIYPEFRKRNSDLFSKGTASIWFPKIVLQGTNYFTDYIIKLRDRGDIPRSWAVEAGGFDFEAALQTRKRENAMNVDEVMMPAAVPHSSPEAGPQDNNTGRPPGAQDGRPSQDPAAPRRTITRNRGETVRATFEKDLDRVVRAGVVTRTILEEYSEYSVGRIKSVERKVIEEGKPSREANLAMIPVNPGYTTSNDRAVNLTKGLRMVIGERLEDKALVAKLLVFREPEYSTQDAEDTAARWGFPLALIDDPNPED